MTLILQIGAAFIFGFLLSFTPIPAFPLFFYKGLMEAIKDGSKVILLAHVIYNLPFCLFPFLLIYYAFSINPLVGLVFTGVLTFNIWGPRWR